jgi:hypothetical protein
MLRQYGATEWIDLAEGDSAHSGALKTECETSDTAE